MNQITSYQGEDSISNSLATLISKYKDEMLQDYDDFFKLAEKLKNRNHKMVITHGDPAGNVLLKSPTDLYLIDWDDILLSPPERDTWFLRDKPEFMRGYKEVVSEYKVDEELCHYFTYQRYFEDLIEYFAEIRSTHSNKHREKNLNALRNDCFEGWLRPAIRKFSA